MITKEDNGKEIAVPEGEIFEVRLEHAGGTGYLWQIVEPDETHLRVLESTEIPLKEGRIVGGPLLKTWKIKAVKAGHTDLKILLYRPWEGTGKAADSLRSRFGSNKLIEYFGHRSLSSLLPAPCSRSFILHYSTHSPIHLPPTCMENGMLVSSGLSKGDRNLFHSQIIMRAAIEKRGVFDSGKLSEIISVFFLLFHFCSIICSKE